jgi:hypothetical protein
VPEGLGRPPDLTAPLPDNLTVPSVGAMNVWTARRFTVMQLETKYLRLSTAVTLGSRFGEWRVCWRGGWSRRIVQSQLPSIIQRPEFYRLLSAIFAIHAGHAGALLPLHSPVAALRRCLRRVLHEWPHFNGARARGGNPCSDGDGFVEIFGLDQVVAPELLARLRERTVGREPFAVA